MNIGNVDIAANRIRAFIQRTPIHTSSTLNRLAGRQIYCKCELFQTTGSFKYRGATNAVQSLTDADAMRGVVTHSSGNHGQALARAAQVRGIPCTVVMPGNAAEVKRAAVLGYGAHVVESGPNLAEREAKVAEVQQASGAVIIPPFDHADVIAGQGTAALELFEEVPDLDAVVAPIGGGGLISGFCLAAKSSTRNCRVIGAEPVGANAAALSKAAKSMVHLERAQSIADGLLANHLGRLTWPIVRDGVERVIVVSEEQIASAMRFVWERMKLVIEPSSAVGIAAVLTDEFRELNGLGKVGVILCGGNVDLSRKYW